MEGVWVRTYVGLAAPWHGWLTKGELKDVPQEVRKWNCDQMAHGILAIVQKPLAKTLFEATTNSEQSYASGAWHRDWIHRFPVQHCHEEDH